MRGRTNSDVVLKGYSGDSDREHTKSSAKALSAALSAEFHLFSKATKQVHCYYLISSLSHQLFDTDHINLISKTLSGHSVHFLYFFFQALLPA